MSGNGWEKARAQVKKMREKGYTDEQIRQNALEHGWTEEQVEKLLPGEVPRAPPPPPPPAGSGAAPPERPEPASRPRPQRPAGRKAAARPPKSAPEGPKPEGCGEIVLAVVFGVAAFVVVLVSLAYVPVSRGGHPGGLFASTAGAGAATGLITAWLVPRRRWVVATPLLVILEAGSAFVWAAATLRIGGPFIMGALLGVVFGVGLIAVCPRVVVRPPWRHVVAVGLLLTYSAGFALCSPWALLRWAVDGSYENVAKLAIAIGADPNGHERRSPLHVAASRGDAEMTRLLLEAGAKVNVKRNQGQTPLHRAAKRGHAEIVRLLLEAGADVNATDNLYGQTPLFAATGVPHTNVEVVSLLLEAGADVNARRLSGTTRLHLAASQGHAEVVRLLLEAGADVNAKDNKSHTPLSLAKQRGHTKVADLLRQHGATD